MIRTIIQIDEAKCNGCGACANACHEGATAILRENKLRSITVVRMEVPCCGGIQRAAETALRDCGKHIPRLVVTLGRDGNIIE